MPRSATTGDGFCAGKCRKGVTICAGVTDADDWSWVESAAKRLLSRTDRTYRAWCYGLDYVYLLNGFEIIQTAYGPAVKVAKPASRTGPSPLPLCAIRTD